MNNDKLKSVFIQIETELNLPEYLKIISTAIIDGTATPFLVHNILSKYNIHQSIANIDFINIILQFIKFSLNDNVLTDEEKKDIIYLKRLFRIHPGDFFTHSKLTIENIIRFQLKRIYDDHQVTIDEAVLKNDLQEIFDLSFDQMNEYAKIDAAVSIKNGAEPKNLDVFFTYNEYFKLKSG